MSLIPRDHWFDFDHFYDHFFSNKHKKDEQQFFSPRVDVTERDNTFDIVAELPGVNKDDIEVHLHDGILTIEAKIQEEKASEKDKVIRKERRSGFFSRSFTLGANVDASDISANFKDGLLTLKAPKIEPDIETKRKIEIS